jgi:hypothetical protein
VSADVRTDLLSMPQLSTPDLLAVHGEKATAAWRAWNAALDARCTHELTCFDGCRNTIDCCPEGARLAWAEQQAYIDWDTLASDAGVPSESAYIEVDDAPEDILLGLSEGLRISLILWGGMAITWAVFHVLSRGAR